MPGRENGGGGGRGVRGDGGGGIKVMGGNRDSEEKLKTRIFQLFLNLCFDFLEKQRNL